MLQKSPYKKGGMFEGANHLIFGFANQLRKEMTDSEKILWTHLKSGIQNFKFRKQHPIGIYVADFFCHKLKLIIEVDGSIHNVEEIKINDKEREKYFTDLGYIIIRFSNKQVFNIRFSNKQVFNDLKFILAEINSIASNSEKKILVHIK